MSSAHPTQRSRWSDPEKDAVLKAFATSVTADEFFAAVRTAVPDAPKRTAKAYLTFLNDHDPTYKTPGREVLYKALNQRHREEEAAAKVANPVVPPIPVSAPTSMASSMLVQEIPNPSGPGTVLVAVSPPGSPTSNWIDEVDGRPLPPTTPPATHPANFKPVVKPDPNARVARYFPLPAGFGSRQRFDVDDIAVTFNLPKTVVASAFNNSRLPAGGLSHYAFTALYNSMCDGHDFDHACEVASEVARDTEPKVDPIVPAEDLYTTATVTDPSGEAVPAPVETVAPAVATIKATSSVVVPPIKAVEGTSPVVKSGVHAQPDDGSVSRQQPAMNPLPRTSVPAQDSRQYALEALVKGILDVDQVLSILNVTDPARTGWALGLLASGRITVEQAAKLVK